MLKPIQYDEFSEKGRQIYYQIQPELEKKFPEDHVVLIEVESGDYFVAPDTIQAYEKARGKHPDKEFFIAKVGQISAMLKHIE